MKKIKIRCKGSDSMQIEALEGLQGALKKITADDLAKLKTNIINHGFIAPIFIWRHGGNGIAKILDGHQRIRALRELEADGYTVPALPVNDIQATSEKDARHKLLQIVSQYGRVTQGGLDAFILEGELDFFIMAQEIKIPNVFIDENKGQEIPEAELPDVIKAKAKKGELWILGDHRLLCGDAAREEDVDRLLAGARIHLVNTDPPYNVKLEPRSPNAVSTVIAERGDKASDLTQHQRFELRRHPKSVRGKKPGGLRAKDRILKNDYLSKEEYAEKLKAWCGNIGRVLMPGRAFYIWGDYSNIGQCEEALKAAGLHYSQQIIWVKGGPVLIPQDFMGNHEWCFYGWKKGRPHKFYGPHNITDVWSIKKVSQSKMEHLTEKPVELAMNAIKYSSRPEENILDLFGGAGFTLIGCEQMNRRAFIMELDPLYCDIIIARWELFSGKKAEKDDTES